jgi:hypothetical protein
VLCFPWDNSVCELQCSVELLVRGSAMSLPGIWSRGEHAKTHARAAHNTLEASPMFAVRQFRVRRPDIRGPLPANRPTRLIAVAAVVKPETMAQDNAQLVDRIRGALWG